MRKRAKAKIYWIPFTDGGRKRPPDGPRYSTIIRFDHDNTDLQEEAWSIVVNFDEKSDASKASITTIWFLAYDDPNAPVHFLEPGNKFELLEGRKVVAQGEIFDLVSSETI